MSEKDAHNQEKPTPGRLPMLGLMMSRELMISDLIEHAATVHAKREIMSVNTDLTEHRYGWGDCAVRVRKLANALLDAGVKRGDRIATIAWNNYRHIEIYYAVSSIGAIVHTINPRLKPEQIAWMVNHAEDRYDMFDTTFAPIAAGINKVCPTVETWVSLTDADQKPDSVPFAVDYESFIANASDTIDWPRFDENTACTLCYTSGTTGLPKAARLTQARTQGMLRSFIAPCKITSRDRIYITLPLYHGTGGLCGVGQALMTGASIILRKKFSASNFWDDVADQGATSIVYIGELCRYLVNSPEHPKEKAHALRTGFGNGLRPDIWEEFLTRFNIPGVCEFYGSTEGNVSFLGFDGKVGAVGRIPSYLENGPFGHIAFVKFDVVEEQPIRSNEGFCIKTLPGEPGEAIGRVGDDTRTRFEGYSDEDATKKKILRDVFEKGDMWFRTGDLMSKDELGYIYFVDRIGDTFRWKGENVSTNEVAEFVAKAPGVATANVYGVSVPGTDGRAGMAAITTKGEVDFDTLYAWLSEQLPKYAIPLFFRVQQEAETTGTFKYRKVELVKEGFDPAAVSEPLWYYDPESNKYEPLTPDAYETILSGAVKF